MKTLKKYFANYVHGKKQGDTTFLCGNWHMLSDQLSSILFSLNQTTEELYHYSCSH